MSSRLELALRRCMIDTSRTWLRHLWRALYVGVAHVTAAWISRGTATTVFLTGSLADGEPIYGLSDVDLVAVVPSRRLRGVLDQRTVTMHSRSALLRRLVGHVRIYDAGELDAAASAPYPSYGLSEGTSALVGHTAVRDSMGLLDRPGLRHPADSWRRLRGPRRAPAPVRERQDDRLAAWLELQYRWRWALSALTLREPNDQHLATAVAWAARVWLSLADNQTVAGNISVLALAAPRLHRERETLALAARTITTGRRDVAATAELWGCFVRLARMIAEQVEHELATAAITEVPLAGANRWAAASSHRRDGASNFAGGAALLDWSGLAFPGVHWPELGPPICPECSFSLVPGDPADPLAVTDSLAGEPWEHWWTLRDGRLLARPSIAPWHEGRLRTIELPASDPVSFAQLDGDCVARFPEVRGWSATDRARRAVAEHGAWLFSSGAPTEMHPVWVGGRPSPSWDTPATRSLLLSAARAGLFLQSLHEGNPLLPLTYEDTVEAWGARDPFAAEAAGPTLSQLKGDTEPAAPPRYEDLIALADSVHRMAPYAASAPAAATLRLGRPVDPMRSTPTREMTLG